MEERIREGFPRQRLVVLPASVVARCRKLPVVGQLHVTHIGSYPSAPHHYVERRTGVPQAILIYCMKGSGTLELGGRAFPVEQGHVAAIPPGTPHIYRTDPARPWSIFWIHFDGHQAGPMLESLGIGLKSPLLYVPDAAMLRQAFEEVYACLGYHFSDAGLLAMTGELVRLLGKVKLHYSHPQRHRKAAEDRILETIGFMQRHLDMPLALDDLASQSGQSAPYYCKLFKERTNQSPMAYFIQLKIRKACELLDQTGLGIKEIGGMLGYDDPYYFSRLFRKIQGCSPSAYRQSVKG